MGNTPGLAESLLERALPLTSHATPQVRLKAVALVHHLCAHQPQLWEECGGSNLLRSLSDQSPGVVSAALQAVACLAKHEEAEVAMAAALHLLHQLEDGKMPQDFHYKDLHLLISKGHPGALKAFLRRAGPDWIDNIYLEDILLCHVFHNERQLLSFSCQVTKFT